MFAEDKVYLASSSPRRRELVGLLFNNVKYLTSKLDEPSWRKGVGPKDYLSHCLSVKWDGALLNFGVGTLKLKMGDLLLVADTTVDLGEELLEKPESPAHAVEMLKRLSGKTHIVRSGLVFGRYHGAEIWEKVERHVETQVTFHKLSSTEIANYVKTGDPMDKAGAYGFQDQALRFVKNLKGSYLNVIGLPLDDLKVMANELGLIDS